MNSPRVTRALSLILAFALCTPLLAPAQSAGTAPEQQQPAAAQPPASQQGTTVNPAQGPLEPVPTSPEEPLPNAPSTQQPGKQMPAQETPAQPAPHTQNQTEPLGTATAPGVRSVGGGASKPAGTAIAPAKQRQYRSLFVKLGLIAGAGVALGTVYALSRGTSSLPPGSGR